MTITIQVLLPVQQEKAIFDYYADESCMVGDLVVVSFRNQEKIGIVWAILEESQSHKAYQIKSISYKFSAGKINQSLIKLIAFIERYNLVKLGSLARLILYNETIYQKIAAVFTRSEPIVPSLPALSEKQNMVVEDLRSHITTKPLLPIVIDGITGSGKTEVYNYIVGDVLVQDGAQVIILLPEIMLTSHLIERFSSRFNLEPAVWHSNISIKRKKEIWYGVLFGDIRLVIGTRSALFLPFQKLRLIVVDEEHDGSYKQEEGIIYNARDVAVVYANLSNIPILLISATPSLETHHNISVGKYRAVYLDERYNDNVLPKIQIVDMRKQFTRANEWISNEMKSRANLVLKQGKQVLFFLNRKGYAPISFCSECRVTLSCKHCSAFLIMHKHKQKFCCHHCGYQLAYSTECTSCHKKDAIVSCGPGTERILEEAKQIWPDKRIISVTRDDFGDVDISNAMIESIAKLEVDIIVGTQILSKGYHFPFLGMVGIIDGDMGFIGADLKAAERTYQLLVQVSGRAGRESAGEAVIQTYLPENPILQALIHNRIKEFYDLELEQRRVANMPPFSRLVGLVISSANEAGLQSFIKQMSGVVPSARGVMVLGPVEAPLYKIRRRYRYRFLVKSELKINVQEYLRSWFSYLKIPRAIRVKVDVDPQNFL